MCVPHCRDRNIYASGSQPLVDGDPHNRIKHNLATHLLPKYYYNPGFGDPKVSARDPKVGLDPPVENHWSIPRVNITYMLIAAFGYYKFKIAVQTFMSELEKV